MTSNHSINRVSFTTRFFKDTGFQHVFSSQDLANQMSRPQDPPKSFLPFGNPFRMILPKGSSLSPKLLDLLNAFEENLSDRLRTLKPADDEDVLCLQWMASAMELLCGIHADIKVLITALELPVCDWDDKWIDVYLDNSVKLLDICIAFTSEISRLKQGHLFLQCLLHDLDSASLEKFIRARSSLDGWRQHMGSNNLKLDSVFSVMDSLVRTLDLPKIKNSSKAKVLFRAMYGVKIVTLFICSVLAAALSRLDKNLIDLPVPETFLWAPAFSDLKTHTDSEIRNAIPLYLKEVEAVESGVRDMDPIVGNGVEQRPLEGEALQRSKSGLGESAGELSRGLDLLGKEVDSFFHVVLTGRDALLSNLRLVGDVSDEAQTNFSMRGEAVR